MRLATLTAGMLIVALYANFALAEKPLAPLFFSLPIENGLCGVRLEVLVGGQSPVIAWERFLDRLFDFVDQNHDGVIGRAELGRMMPLPLPDRQQLSVDFSSLDRDGSGGASLAELKTECHQRGFTPLVIGLEPPSAEDLRLAGVFRQWLDENDDGRFTAVELGQAAQSMSRYDLNEDDLLDRDELLSIAARSAETTEALPRAMLDTNEGDALLRVNLDAAAPAVAVEKRGAGSLTSVAGAASRQNECFRGPGNRWMLVVETRRTLPSVEAASDFLIAQFQTALGSRSVLPRSDIAQDAALSGLAELAPFADRNGDDRLSPEELKSFTDLIAAAVQSQVWVTVTDRGENQFPLLDGDADGRLSYLELRHASDTLDADADARSLPRQIHVTFGAAPVRSWGGMMIPAAAKKRPSASQAVKAGPRWFQAIDRNGDGVASPREFLGPPAAFQRFDRNGDGMVSLAEAEK